MMQEIIPLEIPSEEVVPPVSLSTEGLKSSLEWTWTTSVSAPKVLIAGESNEAVIQVSGLASAIVTPVRIDLVDSIDIRAMVNKSIVMDKPAIYLGKPITPDVWATGAVEMSSTGLVKPDPDDAGSGQESPSGISHNLHVWRIKTLTGNQTAGAGKTGANDEYWVEEWKEVSGGLKWYSEYPYRPRYYPRYEFLRNNKYRVYSKALNFNSRFVEHMWLDLGTHYSSMTIMISAIFDSYWSLPHHVFDAGRRTPVYTDVARNGSHKIRDKVGYRAAMMYSKKASITGASDRYPLTRGKTIRARHYATYRPKVLFTVFNGSESLHGSMDPKHTIIKKGKLQSKSFRHIVMGRKQNSISSSDACDMTVFEVRIWDGPLTKKQLKRQAKRMASRYKFNKYW